MSGRVLGITGAVGAGKSTVCQALRARGWSVLDVDDAASQALLDALPEVALAVPAAMSVEGLVDKGALIAAMMSDAAVRARVEALLRPHVVSRINAWIQALEGPGALEAALLFESRLDELCDATLCIRCSRDERRRRVEARRTASAKHFDTMEAAQLPESEKARRAGAVMSSDGKLGSMDLEIDTALKQLGFSSPAV